MSTDLFSRAEALGGLPMRHARALLFLIESRTAHLAAQSKHALQPILPEAVERERDLEFLDAFAVGREPPHKISLHDLERFASQWARLVPDTPQLRAALAHLFAEKYHLTRAHLPQLRAALGLDTETVQRAYEQLYYAPLASIYKERPTFGLHLGWLGHALTQRVEALPPFWTAFALTFTETVGSSILALPIALSGIGPLPSIALLVVLGLINVMTIAFIAESVARTGSMRYGSAYFGRLISEYLGGFGSSIVSVALTLICIVALLSYYLGFATTLANVTNTRAELWAGALFLIGLYFITRGSLASTVTSALGVGAINTAILIILSAFALTHFKIENAEYMNLPFVAGRAFDPSLLQLIFGVVVIAYFGHTSIGNCAKIVLRRDPSSRALLWGTMSAQFAAIGLYSLWVFAVNSALAPAALANEQGTALAPLALQAGALVNVLGGVYVVLGMGMASVHYSLGLMNLVRERLPLRAATTLLLPRDHGRLIFHSAQGALNLMYAGVTDGQAQLRAEFDNRRVEFSVGDKWDADEWNAHDAEFAKLGLQIELQILEANDTHARVKIFSTPPPKFDSAWSGEIWHKVCAARASASKTGEANSSSRSGNGFFSFARGRFLLSILPVVAIFLVTEYLLVTRTGSFTGVLSVGGVIGASVFVGIFPVLLLASSRRKGDWVPGVVYRFFGQPILLGGIFLFFVAALVVQGLFIFQDPLERLIVFAVALLILVLTINVVRRGAFVPRAVVELRGGERAAFNITTSGEARVSAVRLAYADHAQTFSAANGEGASFSDLRGADFQLARANARELKVWVHRVTPDGNSESVPARAEITRGDKREQFDLHTAQGQIVVPFDGEACEVQVEILEPTRTR